MVSSDRSLHFIVRHDNYDQTIGYRHFVQSALARLNEATPQTPEVLLDETALALRNYQFKNGYIIPDSNRLLDSLPDTVRRNSRAEKLRLQAINLGKMIAGLTCDSNDLEERVTVWQKFEAIAHPVFGQTACAFYGFPMQDNYTLGDSGPLQGAPMFTLITLDKKAMRGYWDTVSSHYGLTLGTLSTVDISPFDYEIPGTSGRKLPLMQICTKGQCEERLRSMMYGSPDDAIKQAINNQIRAAQADDLVFIHPKCDASFQQDLIRCLNPLWETLVKKPKSSPVPGTLPPDDKLEAMLTIYWLVAQSTPIVRGGSAYANIVLEHMADRLRSQGYDYDIPYTREGVDLWAQAASLPLEDRGNLQGFKTRFKDGVFFDVVAKNEDIEQYLNSKLQSTEAVRPAFTDQMHPKAAGTLSP